MKLILRHFELKLKHIFTISSESIDVQLTLIVELQANGFSGFGEATSNPYYNISTSMMIADLEKFKPNIKSSCDQKPENFWYQMQS